jgi:hypothetical protein
MGLVETFHARQENAITALRTAIAEAETREPVAWGMMTDHGEVYDCVSPRAHAKYVQYEGRYTVPLYTTQPAAQRTWVGLTKEDIVDCLGEPYWDDVIRKAEAKLKGKNT